VQRVSVDSNLLIQEVGPSGVPDPEWPNEAVQEEDQEGQKQGELPAPGDGDAGGQAVGLLLELGPQTLHSPLQVLQKQFIWHCCILIRIVI
jgi:hypothetical protein